MSKEAPVLSIWWGFISLLGKRRQVNPKKERREGREGKEEKRKFPLPVPVPWPKSK